MADKPFLLVTRSVPKAVEDRLKRDYRMDYNAEDRLWDGAEIIARAEGADAILACSTESFSADVIARLPRASARSPPLRWASTTSTSWQPKTVV